MTATTVDALDIKPQTIAKPVSQWGLAWRRLRRHKLAMIGLTLLTLIVLLCIFASVIAPYDPEEMDLLKPYAPLMTPGEEGMPMHIFGTDALGRVHEAGAEPVKLLCAVGEGAPGEARQAAL